MWTVWTGYEAIGCRMMQMHDAQTIRYGAQSEGNGDCKRELRLIFTIFSKVRLILFPVRPTSNGQNTPMKIKNAVYKYRRLRKLNLEANE